MARRRKLVGLEDRLQDLYDGMNAKAQETFGEAYAVTVEADQDELFELEIIETRRARGR